MGASNLVVAVARETIMYLGLEPSPGQQVLPGGTCVQVLASGAGSVQQNMRKMDDPQYRNTLSKLDPIVTAFDTGKWSFPTLIKTVQQTGSPATPGLPEADPLFQCLFGLPSDDTQTAWFGDNSLAYLLRSTNPAGTVYPSMTIWFKVGHTMFCAIGATVNQGEFTIAGNDLVKTAWSGEFMRHLFAGTDVVISGAGTTSLVVADATKFFIPQPGDTFQLQYVDSVTGGLGGHFTVTAIDYDTNTLTTTGDAGTAGGPNQQLVAPYLPVGVEVGTPLYGKYGVVRLGSNISTKVQADLPQTPYIVQSCRVTFTNNIRYHPDLKDNEAYPTEYVNPVARTCEGEVTVFMYRDLPSFMYKALRDPLYQDYLIVPMQDRNADQGRIAEFHCPRVEWETPNVSGEDEKTATIAFKSTASPSYNDEAAFVFLAAPSSSVTTSTT